MTRKVSMLGSSITKRTNQTAGEAHCTCHFDLGQSRPSTSYSLAKVIDWKLTIQYLKAEKVACGIQNTTSPRNDLQPIAL